MANHIPTQRVTDDDIESLDDIIDTIRELAHDDSHILLAEAKSLTLTVSETIS